MASGCGSDWKSGFEKLKTYVESNKDILVTRQSLSIPEERRGPFYSLVEETQKALAVGCLGDGFSQGKKLAGMCVRMKERLMEGTDLKGFRLASILEDFIQDPEMTMAKPAFGIILDGLQQGLSQKEIESRSARQMLSFCKDLFRNGYEAWLYYGIVASLRPVHFYSIYSPDTVELQAVDTGYITIGAQITSPERRMPEAVFVTEDDRIFAMKSEVAGGLVHYGIKITHRQGLSSGGDTSDQVAHRVLLLYQIGSLEKIPVLADRERLYLLPSDLMCEFLMPEEMERPYQVSMFIDRIGTVRSRRPVQVLTWDEKGRFPDGMTEDARTAPIERRIIGQDERKLKEIAALLD